MSTISKHEVLWDGNTVWVNSGEDGSSLGRFSKMGTDVHLPATEQMEKQCLDCYQDQTQRGWMKFIGLMLGHYGVVMPAESRPKWLGITAREIVEVQPMTMPIGEAVVALPPKGWIRRLKPRTEYPPEIERREIKWVDCWTCKGKGTDPKKRTRRCPEVMCRNGKVPDGDPMCDCKCHDGVGIMHVMECCEWSGLPRRL